MSFRLRPFLCVVASAASLAATGCSDDAVPPPGDSKVTKDSPVPGRDARFDARFDARSDAKLPVGDTKPPVGDAKPPVDAPIAVGPCPASLPSANSACTKAGLVCEYGTDPRCLSSATCQGGKWTVLAAKCAPPDPTCPATLAVAAGQVCATKDAYCNYSGQACDCTNCIKYPIQSCSGPLKWSCEPANTDKSCPVARPNLGTACAVEGKLCEYGCEPDASRKCVSGGWVTASAPGGCPVSTRKAKREISYLDEAARERVAEEASKLRLATYRYRDPALGGRTHLGFILEDHPRSLASDLEKQQVDLYSYASMTLALAQRQQKQLDELRAEVAALRGRVASCAPRKR